MKKDYGLPELNTLEQLKAQFAGMDWDDYLILRLSRRERYKLYWNGNKHKPVAVLNRSLFIDLIEEGVIDRSTIQESGKAYSLKAPDSETKAAESTPQRRESDMVNHPAHYGGADNPYEVIKVLRAWGLDKFAYLWNTVKYIARADLKGKALEDLKKARFYLDEEIKEREAIINGR
jgi:hypothetical protein